MPRNNPPPITSGRFLYHDISLNQMVERAKCSSKSETMCLVECSSQRGAHPQNKFVKFKVSTHSNNDAELFAKKFKELSFKELFTDRNDPTLKLVQPPPGQRNDHVHIEFKSAMHDIPPVTVKLKASHVRISDPTNVKGTLELLKLSADEVKEFNDATEKVKPSTSKAATTAKDWLQSQIHWEVQALIKENEEKARNDAIKKGAIVPNAQGNQTSQANEYSATAMNNLQKAFAHSLKFEEIHTAGTTPNNPNNNPQGYNTPHAPKIADKFKTYRLLTPLPKVLTPVQMAAVRNNPHNVTFSGRKKVYPTQKSKAELADIPSRYATVCDDLKKVAPPVLSNKLQQQIDWCQNIYALTLAYHQHQNRATHRSLQDYKASLPMEEIQLLINIPNSRHPVAKLLRDKSKEIMTLSDYIRLSPNNQLLVLNHLRDRTVDTPQYTDPKKQELSKGLLELQAAEEKRIQEALSQKKQCDDKKNTRQATRQSQANASTPETQEDYRTEDQKHLDKIADSLAAVDKHGLEADYFKDEHTEYLKDKEELLANIQTEKAKIRSIENEIAVEKSRAIEAGLEIFRTSLQLKSICSKTRKDIEAITRQAGPIRQSAQANLNKLEQLQITNLERSTAFKNGIRCNACSEEMTKTINTSIPKSCLDIIAPFHNIRQIPHQPPITYRDVLTKATSKEQQQIFEALKDEVIKESKNAIADIKEQVAIPADKAQRIQDAQDKIDDYENDLARLDPSQIYFKLEEEARQEKLQREQEAHQQRLLQQFGMQPRPNTLPSLHSPATSTSSPSSGSFPQQSGNIFPPFNGATQAPNGFPGPMSAGNMHPQFANQMPQAGNMYPPDPNAQAAGFPPFNRAAQAPQGHPRQMPAGNIHPQFAGQMPQAGNMYPPDPNAQAAGFPPFNRSTQSPHGPHGQMPAGNMHPQFAGQMPQAGNMNPQFAGQMPQAGNMNFPFAGQMPQAGNMNFPFAGQMPQAGNMHPQFAGQMPQAGNMHPQFAGQMQAGNMHPQFAGQMPQAGNMHPQFAGQMPQAGNVHPQFAGQMPQAGNMNFPFAGQMPQAGNMPPQFAGQMPQAGNMNFPFAGQMPQAGNMHPQFAGQMPQQTRHRASHRGNMQHQGTRQAHPPPPAPPPPPPQPNN